MPEDETGTQIPESPETFDYTQTLQEINEGVQAVGLHVTDLYGLFAVPPDDTVFSGYVNSLSYMQSSLGEINISLDSLQESIDGHLAVIETAVKKSPVTDNTKQYETIIADLKDTNLHLTNITNISICIMVGTGVLAGILLAIICSNYIRH
ncbi:hypothetical protein [uncultured Robinsoniella sp.]|uniref:hypothetical protein n=1 Tax=uncultured Robinsoniella sp. TaxID=904190 RepID=UPI00374FB066